MSKLINVASFKYRADTSSPWQELTLIGNVSALAEMVSDIAELKTSIIQSDKKTISASGTIPYTLTGLTDAHVVANWGMYSDVDCTTPIPENAPTCDLAITTGTNSWTLVVGSNFGSTFYMKPTFVKD